MPNRRDWLKSGLMLAAAKSASGQLCDPPVVPLSPTSPPITPFVQPLPIMPIAQPVSQLDPAPNPGAHQRYSEFQPKVFYDMVTQEVMQKFHPEMPPNAVWGYGGNVPGPTIHARYGEPVLMRIRNNLPANHVGFGLPSIATHLHNGHTASESDGYPGDYIASGAYRDHHYANWPAGGNPLEVMNTLWYHDHCLDFTAQNVVKGLAGFYLLFDELDSGDEKDINPKAFRLPSGAFDVPLMFNDRAFGADGQQLYDVFNTVGIIGDRFTVNGAIQPYFQVARRKYRFRLLNAGPSRFYQFFLSNGQDFIQISNDGNLLPAPLAVRSVTLSVAERADVIVDFSNARKGDRIFLLNRMEQLDGSGPTFKQLIPGDPILRFDVASDDTTDPSRIPDVLRPLPPIPMSEVTAERLWRFDYLNGTWLVNGKLFDNSRADAQIPMGSAEIWTFRNEGTQWSHPIHIHMEEFQILSINGVAPEPGDVNRARKDTVLLAPNAEVKVYMRFRDFMGKYVMHCHNVVHEDHAMMIRFDVVP
jgi:FtsP/CotA-like multicopper oxidase with cupredoxin domain